MTGNLGELPVHPKTSNQQSGRLIHSCCDTKQQQVLGQNSFSANSVPVALEISRSGNGAHAWVFFAGSVSARDARRLGTAIISHTCARTRQLKLESYDRLFPNQDTMPQGGFGNLIALPLQKKPRENGCSVFVDAALKTDVRVIDFVDTGHPALLRM